MKLIKRTFVFLLLINFSLLRLEAKSLEFFLDHTTQETFNLHALPIESTHERSFDETSAPSLYCHELKIENIGDQAVKNCFPYVNQSPCTSLEDLASKLADDEYPLLALYQLWNKSIVKDESACATNCHPLDLLNFKGACSSETFILQFIKLCNSLGIETRLANVHGKSLYDFCLDDEWNFLDLTNEQLYLGLNNEKLVSSEEVMDDPFLALRTKHHRKAKAIDFKEAWKQVASFEILEPASAMPVVISSNDLENRPQKFDLYPHETLTFSTPIIHPELESHERYIEHSINLESREVPLHWIHHSPFPIKKLTNSSSVSIELIDQKVILQPGESLIFRNQEVFHLTIDFDSHPKGRVVLSGICTETLFPNLSKGENHFNLGTKENPSTIRLYYEVGDFLEKRPIPAINVLNQNDSFNHTSPLFVLESPADNIEMIWWQISPDSNFQLIPSNFEQVEAFTSIVTLPLISETFFNPDTSYYFRVKGYRDGRWSEWSTPYTFVVEKPLPVEEVEFNQMDENYYELNWERFAEEAGEPIEYLVFGSNSLDFIPSIYCEKQVNAIVDGEVTEEESNDNLVAITTEPKIKIQGGLAYYRIIARKRGQLSVPSTIIHVYDQELIQPRNVLQVIDNDHHHTLIKRTLFSPSYPWTEISLPHISNPIPQKNNLLKLKALLRSAANLENTKHPYVAPEVSEEIWKEVRPYLLPSNHPAWPKLNRIFCKSRATQNPDTFKKAGFKRWRPGRWSRVSASSHPECKEYFIKAYCDCELGIIYDWKKWIHRIKGAETIRECIKKYKLQSSFSVPQKWLYPLPKNPSPPKTSHYIRKNFILVCENMRIQEHEKNEKMYKKKMTHKLMDGLYTILQVCGLYDSVYVFNIPFCKDGRIAVIDTEYHHKWPVPFHKLKKNFSKEMRAYWERITQNGGRIPNGVNQPNPPRMDRRDVTK